MKVRTLIFLLLAALGGCASELPRRDAAATATAEPVEARKQAPPTFIYRPGS